MHRESCRLKSGGAGEGCMQRLRACMDVLSRVLSAPCMRSGVGHRRCARCTTCCTGYIQEDLSSDCEQSPDRGGLETDQMHDGIAVYDVAYIPG